MRECPIQGNQRESSDLLYNGGKGNKEDRDALNYIGNPKCVPRGTYWHFISIWGPSMYSLKQGEEE